MSKTNNEKYLDRVRRIVAGIQKVAEQHQKHPQEVTKAEFLKLVDDVTPWDIHEVGGLGPIKRAHFPIVDKDLITVRRTKAINTHIAALEKAVGEIEIIQDEALKAIKEAAQGVKLEKYKIPKAPKKDAKKDNMTLEAMISDVHYGKKTELFNLAVCRARMQDFTASLLKEHKMQSKEFNVEKIILALLGDIIESYTMHGMESALGCEFGNTQQVTEATKSLYYDLILPVAKTGVKVVVPCVPGNHDREPLKKTYVDMGKNHLTWVIHQNLKEYCELSGLKNVEFIISEDSYVVLDIYGNNCLYEHGDELNNNAKAGAEALMDKRARQVGEVLHFGRFGHFHEYACYDRGRIIFNESVCGQDGYSKQKGFNTCSGQTINYYVETTERPNCFYRSFPVYLA